MRSAECGVDPRATERRATISSALRTPHSAFGSAVEHRRLLCAPGRSEAKMLVRGSRGAAAARRARQEAALHEKRLVHFLQRAGILAHSRRDGGEPDGPALELLDDRLEDAAVHVVEPELVHIEPLERLAGDQGSDLAAGTDLGVVAHPL